MKTESNTKQIGRKKIVRKQDEKIIIISRLSILKALIVNQEV